jgi:hypothetical protein
MELPVSVAIILAIVMVFVLVVLLLFTHLSKCKSNFNSRIISRSDREKIQNVGKTCYDIDQNMRTSYNKPLTTKQRILCRNLACRNQFRDDKRLRDLCLIYNNAVIQTNDYYNNFRDDCESSVKYRASDNIRKGMVEDCIIDKCYKATGANLYRNSKCLYENNIDPSSAGIYI